jgi:Putative Actinobacterial Holin-X, holin superfamily III
VAVPVRKDVRKDEESVTQVLVDLKDLTVSYAKQETVDPIKGLGRYIGLGVAGSLCLALGVVLLAVGGLRALQTQTGTAFTGNLSWLPYLFTLAFLGVVAGFAVYAISKESRDRQQREEELS